MSTTFYRAFEDRHRGSRELIAKRLEVYLPFISPLKVLYSTCPALDVGCGRGEWLELLKSHGFAARGVDLDEGMLDACRELNLVAEYGDALSALAALDDNSQSVVSAFHLVEHIPFSDVQTLVKEALRVLKPAGLLIMETPNAENLVVGTSNFFLDPTHEKPVPLDLLGFLTEYSGFCRSKVVRLQEDPLLHESQQLTLMDVLGGASPDYAIVAQKTAPPDQLAIFEACFARDYGLSLEHLAKRYESQVQQRHQEAVDKFRQETVNKFRLPELQDQILEIKTELQLVREQRDEALAKAHELWLQACANDSALQALTSSTSWRITRPLRWAVHSARVMSAVCAGALKAAPRRGLISGVRFVLARPALLDGLNKLIKRAPGLHNALKRFAHNHRVITDATLASSHSAEGSVPQYLDSLSVEARQIYHDLKKAIDQKDLG